MPFSQSTLIAVLPPEPVSGGEWLLSWLTTSPVGTWWQIYIDGALSWEGQTTTAIVAAPDLGFVSIGSVLPGEEYTDFSATIPQGPKRKVTLTWQGGQFEGTDLAGFWVYGSPAAFLPIDYTKPLATVTAYPGGLVLGATSNYAWESASLLNGIWAYAVVPFDAAGNAGVGSTVTVAINGPPIDPPPFHGDTRLEYTYSPSLFEVTLSWNAST